MKKLGASSLYAITQPLGNTEADTRQLLAAVAAVLRGGAAIVQYRDKGAGEALLRLRGAALAALCADYDVPIIINDHLWLALELQQECGAGVGLHVGSSDAELAAARLALPDSIIGASCYDSMALAESAIAQGASYVAFGAMFSSSTKPGAPVASLDTVRAARATLSVPIVVIGGITVARAPALLAAGAHYVAVISDLFTADATPDAIEYRAQEYALLNLSAEENES